MQYQGLVFSLDDFPGPVIVRRCTFENNLFRYRSCLKTDVRASGGSALLARPSYENNFKLVHRSANTVHDKVQVKALMNFLNHDQELALFDNTFANHTGLKGIINIDRNPTPQYDTASVLLLNNTFVNSSGLLDSNVLNLRTQVGSASILGAHDPRCGGITLRNNRFRRSAGCQYAHGVVHLYCYDASRSSRIEQVKYVPEVDAQYFIGDHFGGSFGDPSEISASEDGSGTTYAPEPGRRRPRAELYAPLEVVLLEGNHYEENLAGAKRAVV